MKKITTVRLRCSNCGGRCYIPNIVWERLLIEAGTFNRALALAILLGIDTEGVTLESIRERCKRCNARGYLLRKMHAIPACILESKGMARICEDG